MKKLLALFMVLVVSGCSASVNLEKAKFKKSLQEKSDTLDKMIGHWEHDFDGCSYGLSIGEEQEFSLWCACGSPVGNSDLVEYYIYDDESKLFYLYGGDKKFVETMEVELISENELKLDGDLFKKDLPGEDDDEEDLFDISKQNPSEVYDTIKGEWKTEEIDFCDSLTVKLSEDHIYTQICACGECVNHKNYYIYDEETEFLDLYNIDEKTLWMSSRVEIITEDEVEFGGDVYKRIK